MADLVKTSDLMKLILDNDAEERDVRRALAAAVQAEVEADFSDGKDRYTAAHRLAKVHQAQIDILYGHLAGKAGASTSSDDGWGAINRVAKSAEQTSTTQNTDGSTTTEMRRVTVVAPLSGNSHELRRDPAWLARMAMVRTLLTSGETIPRIKAATGISDGTIRAERDRLREVERGRRRRTEERAAQVKKAKPLVEVIDEDGFE